MIRNLVALAVCLCLVSGCQNTTDPSADREHDVFEYENQQELAFLNAAKPFYEAIANRQFETAFQLLGKSAKIDVHPFQFESPDSPNTNPNQIARIAELSQDQFVTYMESQVNKFGPPEKLNSMHVFESDPAVLSGRANDNLDKLSQMFAIGMMSEKIPAEIRQASIRGEIQCSFKEDELQAALETNDAKDKAELLEMDVYPYFTLKTVLVEEAGQSNIGYVEIVPPSMLD